MCRAAGYYLWCPWETSFSYNSPEARSELMLFAMPPKHVPRLDDGVRFTRVDNRESHRCRQRVGLPGPTSTRAPLVRAGRLWPEYAASTRRFCAVTGVSRSRRAWGPTD